jgi:SAM-dependent methyltransferase
MKITKEYFDEEYFTKGTKSNYGPYEIAYDTFERCNDIVERFNPKRILDVGCAYGFFVAQFRMMGIDAYGIDASHYAIETGRNTLFCVGKYDESKKDLVNNKDYKIDLNGYLFEAEAQKIPFPDKFFDMVVSWDTLEHIPEENIPEATKEIIRVGKKQYHMIGTKKYSWDKDESHITIKPLSWWKHYLPNAELHGSIGESY